MCGRADERIHEGSHGLGHPRADVDLAAWYQRRRLGDTSHVNHDGMAVRMESGVGSQLTCADLEPKTRCGSITVAADPALPDVGSAFGEGSDEREDCRPGLADPSGIAAPLKIKDVGVTVVDRSASQCKPSVLLTPLFDVRPKMGLRLFGHPGRLTERDDQFARSCDQLLGVSDTAPTVVTIPTTRHERTV